MEQYLETIIEVLSQGGYKSGRTLGDTISTFHVSRKYDLTEGVPLLTTKDMSKRWKVAIKELIWYLRGEENIKNLGAYAKIWNNWADKDGNLESSYGRFWRRYPVPESGLLQGEVWVDESSPFVKREDNGGLVFDQIAYVLHELKRNPESRRVGINVWHPANAVIAKLPTCLPQLWFYSRDGELSLSVVQRSGDTALGVPFDTFALAALNYLVAKEVGLKPKYLGHLIVDSHIYCGRHDRGKFYQSNLSHIQYMLERVQKPEDYLVIRDWIKANAPPEPEKGRISDHVPGLLLQASREPKSLPQLILPEKVPEGLFFNYDDVNNFKLENYSFHPDDPDFKYGIEE